jgi:3-hydroxymyristoyl/3-hydroxydecanoyl-(acyl carrier protein) dehydratase
VPGVLLLEHVVDAARAWRGAASHLQALPAVKFLSPLRPEERFDIHLEEEGALIRFTCTAGARLLAQGSLTLAADPP